MNGVLSHSKWGSILRFEQGERIVVRTYLALALSVLLVVALAACGSSSLNGTTWKDDSPIAIGSGVSLATHIQFTSATQCAIGVLSGKGTPATYSVSGDQVTIRTTDLTYVFTRSGSTMTGAGMTLHKQ